MTAKSRIARVEDWDRARYAILPARAVIDTRLAFVHVRLLMLIGRVNSEDGWCQFSQSDAAGMFGMSRQTVNLGVSELRKWGYLEVQGQEKTRSSHCYYRVCMDPPPEPATGDCEGEDAGGGDGGVSAGDDTPGEGGVSAGDDTGVVQLDDTGVAYKDTPIDHRSKITTPNPADAGDRQDPIEDDEEGQGAAEPSRNSRLLAGLRADGRHAHVVDAFLAPVLAAKRVSGTDKLVELCKLRSAARDLPRPALEAAARHALAAQPGTLKLARLWDALEHGRRVHAVEKAEAAPTDQATLALRSALRRRLGEEVYRSWLVGVTLAQSDDGDLRVAIPGVPFRASYVRSHYRDEVEAAARAAAGTPGHVSIGSAPPAMPAAESAP